MSIGFAPTNTDYRPRIGTPPINPDRGEINRGRDAMINNIRDKAPLIAAILQAPVTCDGPETGGISGQMNRPKPPLVCYMA